MITRISAGTHGIISVKAQHLTANGWRDCDAQDAERWQARVRTRDRQGRLVKVARVGATREEAESAVKAEVARRAQQERLDSATTVGDLRAKWVEESARLGWTQSTVRQYGFNARHLDALADVPVASLQQSDVNEWLQHVADTAGTLAARSAKSILSRVLTLAVEHGLVSTNLALTSRTPTTSVRRPGYEDRALTSDEVYAILAQDGMAADIAALMIGTGCRISEATSVRWEDVDLADGTIRLRGTKTRSADRVVTMPAWLVGRLKRLDRTGDWLFGTNTGRQVSQPRVSEMMRRLLNDLGLTWAMSQIFRKTAASRHAAEGEQHA